MGAMGWVTPLGSPWPQELWGGCAHWGHSGGCGVGEPIGVTVALGAIGWVPHWGYGGSAGYGVVPPLGSPRPPLGPWRPRGPGGGSPMAAAVPIPRWGLSCVPPPPPQVAMQSLWNIKVVVLVKPEHENRISHVSTSSVKTGIANTLGRARGGRPRPRLMSPACPQPHVPFMFPSCPHHVPNLMSPSCSHHVPSLLSLSCPHPVPIVSPTSCPHHVPNLLSQS